MLAMGPSGLSRPLLAASAHLARAACRSERLQAPSVGAVLVWCGEGARGGRGWSRWGSRGWALLRLPAASVRLPARPRRRPGLPSRRRFSEAFGFYWRHAASMRMNHKPSRMEEAGVSGRVRLETHSCTAADARPRRTGRWAACWASTVGEREGRGQQHRVRRVLGKVPGRSEEESRASQLCGCYLGCSPSPPCCGSWVSSCP